MDLENTENHHALPVETLREYMQDIRLRTQARRDTAARQKREREQARRKKAEELGIEVKHSSDDEYDDDNMFEQRRQGLMRVKNNASFSNGSALRETDEQLFRVFQLFDPMNTKRVPENEILLVLRAVAVDIDEKILNQIINDFFTQQECQQIKTEQCITFPQFLIIVRKAATRFSARQEARRVFENSLPDNQKTLKGPQVLKFEDFKKALDSAEARITPSEISEIYRYCSVTGNREGLTLKDWEEVADFVLENSD